MLCDVEKDASQGSVEASAQHAEENEFRKRRITKSIAIAKLEAV